VNGLPGLAGGKGQTGLPGLDGLPGMTGEKGDRGMLYDVLFQPFLLTVHVSSHCSMSQNVPILLLPTTLIVQLEQAVWCVCVCDCVCMCLSTYLDNNF